MALRDDAHVHRQGVTRTELPPSGRCHRRSDGARSHLGADVGVGVTGVAGPGGGTEEKPVGLVWLSVATGGEERLTRSVHVPGGRADVRDRATTVAMHLIRRALLG